MKEVRHDLFSVPGARAVCITTNGLVKRNGEAVMGAGLAKIALQKFPTLDYSLGDAINTLGNHVHVLTMPSLQGPILPLRPGEHLPYHIISFPTKRSHDVIAPGKTNVLPYYRESVGQVGQRAAGYKFYSPIELIVESAHELVTTVNATEWNIVALPRPGCGKGGLSWESDVRPLLSSVLDDRFIVCTP